MPPTGNTRIFRRFQEEFRGPLKRKWERERRRMEQGKIQGKRSAKEKRKRRYFHNELIGQRRRRGGEQAFVGLLDALSSPVAAFGQGEALPSAQSTELVRFIRTRFKHGAKTCTAVDTRSETHSHQMYKCSMHNSFATSGEPVSRGAVPLRSARRRTRALYVAREREGATEVTSWRRSSWLLTVEPQTQPPL